jgi:hypothetical protein
MGTNLQTLRREIAAAALASGRSEDSVTLVAVSKGHAASRVFEASALGLTQFGESYLQEALPKIQQLQPLPLCWHYIGRIQANKTRALAEHFDWVHGLDRLHVAERLSSQRPHYAPPLQVCIQVNVEAEPAKAGTDAEGALALAAGRQRLAAAAAARLDVHSARGTRFAGRSRELRRIARIAAAYQRAGSGARHALHGHERGFSRGGARGLDPGADRHGTLWAA